MMKLYKSAIAITLGLWKLTKGIQQVEKHLSERTYQSSVRTMGFHGILGSDCSHLPHSSSVVTVLPEW